MTGSETQALNQVALQCRSYGYPAALTEAIIEYLAGDGSLLRVKDEWQTCCTAQSRVLPFWGYTLLQGAQGERLSRLEQRALDIALVTDSVQSCLYCMAMRGPIAQACAYLVAHDAPEAEVLDGVIQTGVFTYEAPRGEQTEGTENDEENEDEDDDEFLSATVNIRPTAAGRLVLTYLPDRYDEILARVQRQRPMGQTLFVKLLLAAEPPYIDWAWEIAAQAPAHFLGDCAQDLLRADYARFAPWARQMVADTLTYDEDDRLDTLRALLARDTAGNTNLALRIARGELFTPGWYGNAARRLCLAALHRSDAVAYLPLVRETMLADDDALAVPAVRLLAGNEGEAEREALRATAAGGCPAAALAATEALLARAWEGRQAFSLTLLEHASKRMRDAGAAWLLSEGSAVFDAVAPLLVAGNADVRATVVAVLSRADAVRARPLLAERRVSDRSGKVRQAIDEAIGVPETVVASGATSQIAALLARADEMLTRARKPPLAWLKESAAAGLRWRTGASVPSAAVRYLLFAQSHARPGALDTNAQQMLALLGATSGGDLALALLRGWIDQGADAKEAWVLPLIAVLGDDRVVPLLRERVTKLGKAARGALAVRVVQALARMGTALALSEVDDLAQSFKPGQVKTHAREAFAEAARQRGLTEEELRDEIVPRLGFDAEGMLTLDYGPRQFTVRPNFDLTLQVWDGTGQLLAALPRASASDDAAKVAHVKEIWQLLKKQLPRAAQAQAARLDVACSIRRSWDVARWKTFFLGHPLLRCLAVTLVWTTEGSDGAMPSATFRPLADGTLVNAWDAPVALPDAGRVRLAHPLEMDGETCAAWVRHVEDYDLTQPFAQINRALPQLDAGMDTARWWRKYEGYTLRASELRSCYARAGWDAHDPDAEGTDMVWKAFPAARIEAVLKTDFIWPGAERYISTPLLGLGFVPLGVIPHVASTNDDGGDSVSLSRQVEAKLLPLGDVPPIVFAEAAGDVERFALVGAYDQNWKARMA